MLQNLLFRALIAYTWLLAMFIDPSAAETIRENNPALYAITVMPAVAFILASFMDFLRLRFDKPAIALLLLIAGSAVIAVMRGDLATLISVGSLCAMLVAIRQTRVRMSVGFANALFFLSIVTAEIMFILGVARYGAFPGQVANDMVAWRASLFAYSVTPSWLFSLVIIGLNYFHNRQRGPRIVMMTLGLYFLIFSASRTGIIVLLLCAGFLACTRLIRFRDRLFYRLFTPLAVIMFVVILNAEQLLLLLTGVDNPLVNAVLFKTTEGVASIDQASTSIIRTFIWAQHMQIFSENPLMGAGTFNLLDTAPEFEMVASTGSESFLTALLARVGMIAAFFVYFMHLLSVDASRRSDRLAYCLTILFAISTLAYGSYIVPYDFVFLALFGAMNSGRPLREDSPSVTHANAAFERDTRGDIASESPHGG